MARQPMRAKTYDTQLSICDLGPRGEWDASSEDRPRHSTVVPRHSTNSVVCHQKPSCYFRAEVSRLFQGTGYFCRPNHYNGYDTQLVIEGVRIRIPNRLWMYFREKKTDFRLK
ncbi:hypothetical protein TNCV_2048941 [Trichonephila clavipes]|nr:hypothetical protein TNCV_2048941 [Trichonephila clavipes]